MGTEGHIRVVIADDRRLFREGIRKILSTEESIEIVGEAANELQTIDLISNIQPDVLILGINMSEMDNIKSLIPIKQKSPQTKPLILTTAMDEASIFRALKAGAKGHLSKDATASDLTKAIQAVHHGELWVERKLIARFVEGESLADGSGKAQRERTQAALTAREDEILHLLSSGRKNKEIAQALLISERTVKSHLNNIFRKLQVSHRLQAVLCVGQHGLTEGVVPTR